MKVALSTEAKCPYCASAQTRKSGRPSQFWKFVSLGALRTYRCESCNKQFVKPSRDRLDYIFMRLGVLAFWIFFAGCVVYIAWLFS